MAGSTPTPVREAGRSVESVSAAETAGESVGAGVVARAGEDRQAWLARLARLARIGVVLMAATYTLVYLVAAVCRLQYPYELQWLEGDVWLGVARVMAGLPLYTEPTLDYVPLLYNPLFFHVAGGWGSLLGAGLPVMRGISLVASIVTFGLIWLLVWRETRDLTAGAVAASLFAATYAESGFSLDVGRVDALFIALLLAGIVVLHRAVTPAGAALAGLLMALAFLTKQTALMMVAPVLLWTVVTRPRVGVTTLGVLAGLIVAAGLLLQATSDGWFAYFALVLPRHIPWERGPLVYFWPKDVAAPLSLALVVACARLALVPWRANGFLVLLAVGLLGGSWVARLHSGGGLNTLMPGYIAVAIGFGVGLAQLRRRLPDLFPRRAFTADLCLSLVCAVQFASLLYNPLHALPEPDDLRFGDALVREIAAAPGEVYTPQHAFLAALAGRRTYAPRAAITDLAMADPEGIGARLGEELTVALAEQRFGLLMLGPDDWTADEVQFTDLRRRSSYGRAFDDWFLGRAGEALRDNYRLIGNRAHRFTGFEGWGTDLLSVTVYVPEPR